MRDRTETWILLIVGAITVPVGALAILWLVGATIETYVNYAEEERRQNICDCAAAPLSPGPLQGET